MLTFLVVIGASFAIMASILTGMVSSTLYQQRTRQATRSLEQLASSAAPFLASAQMDSLSELLTAQAGELGGRLLAVDMDGKVQADTFGARSGQRLSIPETVAVLLHGEKSAFGIHRVDSESGAAYVAVASAVMEVSGKTLGVLVLSLPVDELQTALETVEKQLMTVFLIIAGAAMAAALMLSGMLTRPVKALTQTIRRMGKGDLSARVNVRTSGELKELAESYNAMAEQIEHLDKSRSQFVANASHELKTPLATMKLLLENMLYQPDMPQELRTEFMQDINHEIDRLSGIITDLLTLTQMDSHSSPLARDKSRFVRTDGGNRAYTANRRREEGTDAYRRHCARHHPRRRFRQADADLLQLDGQRHQVHAGKRAYRRAACAKRRKRAVRRHRRRHRHPGGRPEAHFRALLPRR